MRRIGWYALGVSSRLLSLTLIALLVALGVRPAFADERTAVDTEHYSLTSDGSEDELTEWGAVLEAAWPQYAEFFDTEPDLKRGERLSVAIFEDDESFRRAIARGGGTAPSAGGYYCPKARTAYLKRQPSAWYTRNVLLHEAAHQFHYLARTGNDAPSGDWYVEGIAEHLGSHHWDGTTLSVGVEPLLSLEDRAGAALAAVSRDDFSFEALLESEDVSRPEAMYLVRYLSLTEPKKFARHAKGLDRGGVATVKTFKKAFGKPEKVEAAWKEWLTTRQSPLVPVFVEWDSRSADSVRGEGDSVVVCRTRGAAQSLAARVVPIDERRLRAGVLVAFESASDYTIAVVERKGDGGVLFHERFQNGWKRIGTHPIANLGGEPVMSVRREEAELIVSVDGAEIARIAAPAEPQPFGLVLDACAADFADLTIER